MATRTEPWVNEVLNWRNSCTTLPVMYTAPDNMRLLDKYDPIFDPVLVSIGPFHHGRFPATGEHKIRSLSSILDRLGNINRWQFMVELADAVCRVEGDARRFYSKLFPDIDFVKMIILDGCFLLEIFRLTSNLYNLQSNDHPFFVTRWMLPAVVLDIMKLENQLPYFMLEILYGATRLPNEPSLRHLAGSFLRCSTCFGFNIQMMIEDTRPQKHLLSLFHSAFVPRNASDDVSVLDEGNKLNSFPSVTDLCLSGIKVAKKKQWSNLLEIEYNNGKLEIPTLVIDHSTKMLMRNLIAYEQCNWGVPNIFTSYVTFMDALVNSANDVEVLRVAGVIDHYMNSTEEVSALLNGLTANLEYDMHEGYLAVLSTNVYNDHHKAWPQFKARFKRLVNSREGIVYITSIFALYLTVLQTVFTVLSYVLPKKS